MSIITSDAIQTYAEAHSSSHSALLEKIKAYTESNTSAPDMLSGHLQGRLIALLSRIQRPTRILEIGTFTGFSALCLAEGLPTNGRLYTIDIDARLQQTVQDFFSASAYANQIEYLIGDAVELVTDLKEVWDLVFIDADKKNYIRYYDLVLPRMSKGGVLLADNVLWSGRVLTPEAHTEDASTRALADFNAHVKHDPRVRQVMLPIRDGLTMVQKK